MIVKPILLFDADLIHDWWEPSRDNGQFTDNTASGQRYIAVWHLQ